MGADDHVDGVGVGDDSSGFSTVGGTMSKICHRMSGPSPPPSPLLSLPLPPPCSSWSLLLLSWSSWSSFSTRALAHRRSFPIP